MYKHLLALLLLGALLSCGQLHELTGAEKSNIIKEVEQTLHHYFSDIKNTGLTAEFKYLDHSDDFYWVPPGRSSAISYDSVATILNQSAPLYQSIENTWHTLQVTPLHENFATYNGIVQSKMTNKEGKISTYQLVETGVVIKRKDGWKLLNGHTTTVKNMDVSNK